MTPLTKKYYDKLVAANDNQEALKEAVNAVVAQTSRARGEIALAVINAAKNYGVDEAELLKIIKGKI